jgi:ornithine lipid ester-linked acyl 2-hydroxylase
MSGLWFSIYDFTFNYKGDEPAFIKTDNLEWANDLAAKTPVIKDELKKYLEDHHLESYFNTSMVSKQNSWRTIALKTWSIELHKNQKYFPLTTSFINKYPEIISASFNLLEPKSRIKPHCGDTNAIYRCHLGLEIPAGLPLVGFRVKNEQREWKNNEWLVFMDAYEHEAWNESEQARYIFLLDVIRPEYKNRKKFICSTVLTSLFLQKRADKLKLQLESSPKLVQSLAFMLQPLAKLSVSLVNRFKIY